MPPLRSLLRSPPRAIGPGWWQAGLWAIICLAGVGFLPGRALAQAPASVRSERNVKAAYLFNFGRFIAWPEVLRRTPAAPFTIGVLGDDRLADELTSLLTDRTIRDRPVFINRVRTPEDLADLRILVVGEIDLTRWTPALATLRDRPVLLVGPNPAFARDTGHIGFYLEEQRVRFAINPAALRRSDLQASSRLLSLALIIDTDPVAASPAP